MKKFFLIWIVFLGVLTLTFGQTQKTLVKTFPVEQITYKAIFTLQGAVEVEEWEHQTIRIVTTITTPNTTENVLKALIIAGRYNYRVDVDQINQTITVDMPKDKNAVFVNGIDLDEKLEYKVYVPKGMYYHVGLDYILM